MPESVANQQSHFRYSFVIFILFSPCIFMQHHWFDSTDVDGKEKDWKAAASVAGKQRGTHRPPMGTHRFQAQEVAVTAVTGIHLTLLDDITVPSIPTVITKSKSII